MRLALYPWGSEERAGGSLVYLQVCALTETPCTWDKSIRDGERADEQEYCPECPYCSEHAASAMRPRSSTGVLKHRGRDGR